jgi:hypothetical protein
LLTIAAKFDRTTQAIQEVNGIIDPRFLEVGQRLLIPSSREEADTQPTPTPTPLPLTVTTVNFQETRQGTLWCLGEVANPGREAVTGVLVEAVLFDGAGLLLARSRAPTQLDVIPPEKTAPFAILFETPPGNFAQYQVKAIAGIPLAGENRYYFDFDIFDLHGAPEGAATYRLDGKLRNLGREEAEAIRLVAIVYDQKNQVLAQRQAELGVALLKAGAITPFEIDLLLTHGVVDHYQVIAQGLKAE